MNQEYLITSFYVNLVKYKKFNKFVTMSFSRSMDGSRITKADIGTTSRLVRLYAKKLSELKHGRSRRLNQSPEIWTPFIAIPEYRDEARETCHLHYHILILIDDNTNSFDSLTESFWKVKSRTCLQCVPDIDIRNLHNPQAATWYALKNAEKDFTFENIIAFGLGL